jgi:hypothetical protein
MDNHSTIQESESASTKRKLVRRSAEERVAEIDAKIATHQEAIEKLQAKKEEILNPKPRLSKAAKMKAILNVAKESGMTPEEIAEKLGIEFE